MTPQEPPDFPVVPLDGVTEFRIHGVSGTPVEKMLEDPHPVQVWGDGIAGCYRRATDGNAGTDHLEAYSWGGLTARASARAAWLLLLPFMLVNVAAWAHPPRESDRNAAVGAMSGALRVLALVLTVTLLLTATLLGMDVLAWQCAGAPADCGAQHWYTRWLTTGWAARPGARIAIGAVLPILLLVLARWLSRSTTGKYEEWGDERAQPAPDPTVPRGVWDLAHPRFWQGRGPVSRLRCLHLSASYAVLAAIVAYAAGSGDDGPFRALGAAVTTLGAATAAGVALLLFSPLSGRRRELIEGRPPIAAYCTAVRLGPWVTGALLAVALAYAAFLSERPAAAGALAGPMGAKRIVSVVQWSMVALLVVANFAAIRRRAGSPPDAATPPLFRGYAAPVFALLGIVLAGAFSAGLTLRVADYLGCPARCVPGDDVAFELPMEYFWSARSFSVAVLLAIPAIAYVLLVLRPRAQREAAANVEAEYAGHTDPERRRAITKIQATAALLDRATGPLAFVVAGAVVVTGLTNALYDEGALAMRATTAGTWLVGVFALALVALGRSAYRNPSLRRTVGILWDIGTFWPRAAHPFAPPCYCERTVPEFVQRIEQVRAANGAVVVSAHSQGTVIALAAVLQLRDRPDGVALLTYGSPLQRLYARAFPHYFGLPVLGWTRAMLGGAWINLYRRSDPIGGPVTCADADVPADAVRPDRRLRDPSFAKPQYSFNWPVARGHSDYPRDPAFVESVAALANEVRAR